ncbi:terpenoid synthase [Mycena galopus ATCC 62051]|nr:terpenoid synthase [Mycena galopus ATCC 62051]
MESQLGTMYLPDPMHTWPWPRRINPHYRQVSAESSAWLYGLKLLGPKSQKSFDKCESEHLRIGCDLLNLTFVIDEYSEVEDTLGVLGMVEIMLDALENPHMQRSAHEIPLGEATRQFWMLVLQTASESSQKHFLESFTEYLHAVIQEAEDRDADAVLTIDNYLDIRTRNIAAYPCFNPVISELKRIVAHLLILNNDLMSYNKEQSLGRDQYNFITIIMRTDTRMDLPAATLWLSTYHESLQAEFLEMLPRVPSFGPALDLQVQDYLSFLANWPRAQDCWNFESARYFGRKGLKIQATRRVPLLPKLEIHTNPRLRREGVAVPLVEL